MTNHPPITKHYVCEQHALKKVEEQFNNQSFSIKGGGAEKCQEGHCDRTSSYHYEVIERTS